MAKHIHNSLVVTFLTEMVPWYACPSSSSMHLTVAERAKVDEFCYGLLSISESQTLGQSVENIGMLKRLAVVQPHFL